MLGSAERVTIDKDNTTIVNGAGEKKSIDERVNQITPKLFKIADTPNKMIKLSIADIEDIIRPCGSRP